MTMWMTTVVMVVMCFCSGADTLISWSSSGLQAEQVLYACAGDSVSFPWTVSLATGETIQRVEWFYAGRSYEMVAILTHGSFFPFPAFSGRVTLTANEGLVLNHVIVMDSGNYSVAFTVQQSDGSLVTLKCMAPVYVRDGLQTQDGKLHVRMSTEARFDNSTQMWGVALTCGTFLYANRPAFNVTWTLPDNSSTQVNTAYDRGEFLLFLSTSSPGGSYSCRVPLHPASSCLPNVPMEAGVVVDRTELRLLLLDVRQQALVAENTKLKERNEMLTQQMMKGNESSRRQVSFHVRLYTSVHLPTWSPLVMTDVISNHGNAYSNVTGEFRAPYNGTYFFIASTAVYGAKHVANFFLMVEDREVDYAYTNSWSGHSEGGTVHALVTLTRGQRVWLRSYQDSYYLDGPTAFSGFLLYAA